MNNMRLFKFGLCIVPALTAASSCLADAMVSREILNAISRNLLQTVRDQLQYQKSATPHSSDRSDALRTRIDG